MIFKTYHYVKVTVFLGCGFNGQYKNYPRKSRAKCLVSTEKKTKICSSSIKELIISQDKTEKL